jgi:putative ABC transport system permease protein
MFRNYFVIAIRQFKKGKAFSLINVLGLAVGMTCCFLIMIFVRDEMSFDRNQKKFDRIYRIVYLPKFAGLTKGLPVLSPAASPLLKDNFPGIEASARLFERTATIDQGAVKLQENRFFFVDSTLLDIFSFQFLEGNPRQALQNPFGVLLSASTAHKYFGNTPALGKSLRMDGRYSLLITGVFADFPDNSHIHIDMMANYQTMFATLSPDASEILPRNWIISHSYTYVLLRPNQDPARINAGFPAFLAAHAPATFAKDIEYHLQPLKDIHLRSDLLAEVEPVGNITQVYIFVAIALATLLIAGINFVNLSTARSLRRAKEVGMRKVLGAEKRTLIGQFLAESLLLTLLAFILSILLLIAFLPAFNDLTDKNFTLGGIFSDGKLWLEFGSVFLLTGLIAGIYPAFFISAFEPISSLKGEFNSGRGRGGFLRKILLVFQFSASVGLMIAAIVIFRQLQYIRTIPLGFEKEQTLTIALKDWDINSIFTPPNDSVYTRLEAFRQKLLTNPGVREATLSDQRPGQGILRKSFVPEGFTVKDNVFAMSMKVDYSFIPTYKMQLAAGRNFSPAYGSDKDKGFIINETAVQRFHWKTPAAAIGRRIKLLDQNVKEGTVIGVVKDFHAESLFTPIDALVMDIHNRALNVFSIKMRPGQINKTIASVHKEWDAWFPERNFQYEFLDKGLNDQYQKEEKLGTTIGYFAGLAVFVSCLGLLGLIALIARQRNKEIGIRKVLGASAGGIVALLSKDFILLIAISIGLSSPLAWWTMHQWLAHFAYRVGVSWWMIALSAGGMALIALLTLCIQAIKAAFTNPLRSLRSE